MIRTALDTNLIISHLLTQGAMLLRVIDHWEYDNFIPLVLLATLQEFREVSKRPRLRRYMITDPQVLFDLSENDAEHISGELTLIGICRDPKDDIFLACAVEGEAECIVSRDVDLMDLGSYKTPKSSDLICSSSYSMSYNYNYSRNNCWHKPDRHDTDKAFI